VEVEGGYVKGVFSRAIIGSSQNVIIGSGGNGGAPGESGTDGTATAFGNLMNARPGKGGMGSSVDKPSQSRGGEGGDSEGGFVIFGGNGGRGCGWGYNDSPLLLIPGAGGSTPFSMAEYGSLLNSYGGCHWGLDGRGFGGGGSGASAGVNCNILPDQSPGIFVGGGGRSGYCIVTEFI
jgi:hypothetical protein